MRDGGLAGESGGVPVGIRSAAGEEAAVPAYEKPAVGELSDGACFGWCLWSLELNAKRGFMEEKIMNDEIVEADGLGEEASVFEQVVKWAEPKVERSGPRLGDKALRIAGFKSDAVVLRRWGILIATGPI